MIIDQAGYQVTILRKPIKNINLRIDRMGNVTLSAPLKCPFEFIQTYLNTKHGWINFHQKRRQAQITAPSLQFQSGEQHFFLGKAYELLVEEPAGKEQVICDNNRLYLYIKGNTDKLQRQAVLTAWYRQQFKTLLPDLIIKWQPVIGVHVADWGIKAMKTRWGSCNTRQKRVWLNLKLIQSSLDCIEYVLVHEMVHLLEPSHNPRFYALMTQFMPNWQVFSKQLRNGSPPSQG